MPFILGNLERKPLTGEGGPDNLFAKKVGHPKKWMGHCLISPPLEAHTAIDFTGPPGSVSGIYYSLMFQLKKWEYNVEKFDESIDVSPVHAQYYQLTHKQKEDLEGRIKSGLQSMAQASADLELVLHDLRKYEEFLRYMGYRTPNEIKCKHGKNNDEEHPDKEKNELCLKVDDNEKQRKEREKLIDNHSLKAVFIDQVDVHTGDGIAIKSIVSRWPTLIIDFMKLEDADMDIDKVSEKIDISKAEAVVLITKNKLFVEWKRLFLGNLKDRYRRIMSIKIARDKSVDEYKDWLTPIIARHRLIKESLANPGGRAANMTNFVSILGQATSYATVEIWVWKDFSSPEFYKSGSEEIAKLTDADPKEPWKMKLSPYDTWTKKNLIFNKEHGLVTDYKWITDEWAKKQLKWMYDHGWLTKNKMYYSVFIIKLDKGNIKSQTGDEVEDGIFDVNMIVMSQNAMFAKLLELRAKQHEFEEYVNEMVGIRTPVAGEQIEFKDKDMLKSVRKFFEYFSLNLQFFYGGPYEKNFEDRVTKYYLAPVAGERYGAIVGFIKDKIGMGK